jgi:YHS domain-containing protein
MKRLLMVVVLSLGLVFSGVTFAADGAGTGKPQANCPVMAGKIDKKVYADYQGKRVYFCCTGCLDAFKKDPEKYIKQLESEGVVLEKAPDAK